MGTAAKKKRPMRSRKSGVKKLELVKNNLDILKKLIAIFFIITLVGCITPYRITETYTVDSLTGKQVKVVNKFYDHTTTTVVPQASFNVVTTPLFYPYYTPRIVVPTYRPVYHSRRH